PRLRQARGRVDPGVRLLESIACPLRGRGGRPVHCVLRRGRAPVRQQQERLGLCGHGLSRRRAERQPGHVPVLVQLPQAALEGADEEGVSALMAERVDVCIIGSGFGGSISAWRLAELYMAAGADPKNILVLERGRRYKHTEFKQSMSIDHLSNVYNLIQCSQGSGGQLVVANAVGGGSNLYLAASLRSPTEIFERRDH